MFGIERNNRGFTSRVRVVCGTAVLWLLKNYFYYVTRKGAMLQFFRLGIGKFGWPDENLWLAGLNMNLVMSIKQKYAMCRCAELDCSIRGNMIILGNHPRHESMFLWNCNERNCRGWGVNQILKVHPWTR